MAASVLPARYSDNASDHGSGCVTGGSLIAKGEGETNTQPMRLYSQ